MPNRYVNPIFVKECDEYSMCDLTQQVNELLQLGYCSLINTKDYQLEAAASAVNGLIGEHETADIYLYAAIERNDWHTVTTIYKNVFRPHLYEHAKKCIIHALNKASKDIY